jgi:hypothetical protein
MFRLYDRKQHFLSQHYLKPQTSSSQKFLTTIAYGLLPLVLASPLVAIAHTVKTDANVAATFHIEPNHHPKAGEPAQAWFVLTQQGGQQISLAQCNCKLTVYDKTRSPASVVLEPTLTTISAEQYRDVPGAEIVFPKPGLYSLELSGSPATGANFQPFKLSYSVTVGAGNAIPNPSKNNSAVQPSPSGAVAQSADQATAATWQTPAIVLGVLAGLGVVGGGIWAVLTRNRTH